MNKRFLLQIVMVIVMGGHMFVMEGQINLMGDKICHMGTLEFHRLLTSKKLITKKENIIQ